MPRVSFSHTDDLPVVSFPQLPGISSDGLVASQEVFREGPLAMWTHELQPGSSVRWHQPPVGHAMYVMAGDAAVGSSAIGVGGAVIVEHGAQGSVTAGEGTVRLAHFHRVAAVAESRAGGHTHVVGQGGLAHIDARDGRSYTLLADASCPTCELWLHRAKDMPPGYPAKPHKHTSDEIIFILGGSMLVGRKELTPGAALSIEKDTAYAFTAGPRGLALLNFRDRMPFYIAVTRDGTVPEPINERELILNGVFFGKRSAE